MFIQGLGIRAYIFLSEHFISLEGNERYDFITNKCSNIISFYNTVH